MDLNQREESGPKPIVVYYLHYYDDLQLERAFNKHKDFAICVMAESSAEAIEKAKTDMWRAYDVVPELAKA